MADQMEVLLKIEHKPETVAILQFIEEMTPAEQRDFLILMQGAKLAKSMDRKNTVAAQPV